ncbi:MAG: ATP-binding cassette domain-containing protein, partial [Halobacteriaceae archaeon]
MSEGAGGEDEPNDVVISVEEVNQSLGGVDVLKDISLEIERGSITAIIGPNGSGKTTLSRLVAGLDSPSEGEIVIHSDRDRP